MGLYGIVSGPTGASDHEAGCNHRKAARLDRDDQMPTELPHWLKYLRRSEIIDRVRNDPRSTEERYLGMDRDTAVREVVGGRNLSTTLGHRWSGFTEQAAASSPLPVG